MNNKFSNYVQNVSRTLPGKPIPIKYLFSRTKQNGMGSEQLLSLYRDYGVVPKHSRDDNFNKASDDLTKYQIVKPGDLVVNKMKAWQGSLAISGEYGIISPAYFVYRPVSNTPTRYLHYVLRSRIYKHEFRKMSYGVRPSQWDLDPHSFSRLPVVCPDKDTAIKIVDFLDHETTEIDALIGDLQSAAELIHEHWESSLVNLIQQGSENDGELMETGLETWPRAPRTWTYSRLKNSVKHHKNGAWGSDPHIDEVTVRCIRVADFDKKNARVHALNPTERSYTAGTIDSQSLQTGDLLIEKSGGGPTTPVGNVVLYEGEGGDLYSNFIARVSMNAGYEPLYMLYLHRSLYLSGLSSRSVKQSTGIQNLDMVRYLNEEVYFPPFHEQRSIAQEIEEQRLQAEAARKNVNEAIDLAKERRVALISAAVTGQIDVTEKRKPVAEVLEDEVGVRV